MGYGTIDDVKNVKHTAHRKTDKHTHQQLPPYYYSSHPELSPTYLFLIICAAFSPTAYIVL